MRTAHPIAARAMSRTTAHFDSGLITGVLLMLAASAAHWLLTGHPDAGPARTGTVIAQLLVGLGGSAWLVRSRRRPR